MVSQQSTRIPRRTGTTFTAALVLALAGATLSGCKGLVDDQKMLTTAQLKSELLTAPLGSKPYARGTLAPGGVLNLDQFVDGNFSVSDRVSEKEAAQQQGFANAVETNWNATDGTAADIFLIQFKKTAGAEDFVSGVSEATASDDQPSEPLAKIPGIPGGETLKAGALDSVGKIRQSAWFSYGNVAVDLHFYSPATANEATMVQLAQAQYARVVGNLTSPSPLPSSSATAPAPTSTAPAAMTSWDQHRLLADLVAPTSGSRPWSNNSQNGPTGILTLPQLLIHFADTAVGRQQVSAEETDRGFQYAVRENWHGSNGSQADIHLLQFATATGAQSFALDYQSSAADTVGAAGTFTIPDSGDTTAYQHSTLTSDGYIWTEGYAVVGNIAVDFDYWMPAKADRATVTALLQKQYAKLMDDPTVATAAQAAPALPSSDS